MNNIKKTIHIYIITIFILFFNILMLIFPKEIMNSVKTGLLLWYNNVLPALLPFIFAINMLKKTPFPYIFSKSSLLGRVFHLSSYGMFAAISGFLSGYPVGAKIISDLYAEKKIDKTEAQYLLSFANNSGPLFITGTVGTALLKSSETGFFLLIIHYISALIIAVFHQKPSLSAGSAVYKHSINIGSDIKESLVNAIEAVVTIGGYIVVFSIICSLLSKVYYNFHPSENIRAVLFGILELTRGCSEIKSITPLSLSIISGLIGFGGISVHTQSIGYISSAGLDSSKYIHSKIIQGIISFLLCYTILNIPK